MEQMMKYIKKARIINDGLFPNFIDSDSCKIDSNTDSKLPLQRFQSSKCVPAKTN